MSITKFLDARSGGKSTSTDERLGTNEQSSTSLLPNTLGLRNERALPESEFETTLAREVKASGVISIQGNARIDGEVEGEVHCFGTLHLGPQAVIRGNVFAVNLDSQATVLGDLFAEEKITLRAPAKVQGSISAPILRISEGVLFEGNCTMKGAPISSGAKSPQPTRQKRPIRRSVQSEVTGRVTQEPLTSPHGRKRIRLHTGLDRE